MENVRKAGNQIQRLKRYLNIHDIAWKPTEEWSLIFSGNHAEGIFINADEAPLPYINKLDNLAWEYRGHYTAVYVYPKELENENNEKQPSGDQS